MEFQRYVTIKNNYCICYFGHSEEYLLQLKLLKPAMEQHFPGLNIYLGCRDEKVHLLDDPKCLKVSELRARREEFAYIKELQYNGSTHPVEDLLVESGMANFAITTKPQEKTQRCVILTKGNHPTKPLESAQLEKAKKTARNEGFDVEVDQPIDQAGLVIGVECYELFRAAAAGIETRLVPTGVGTRLYSTMFPFGKLMHT